MFTRALIAFLAMPGMVAFVIPLFGFGTQLALNLLSRSAWFSLHWEP